ncbi:MAG: ABC transporter permease, partial [Actinobacteria bacterium]|nr:ABC transporter permease [Actinomycetota bacterium]
MTWLRRRVLLFVSLLTVAYLMLPLLVIIVLSFNKPKGRQNTAWNEFSLAAWTNICRDQTICDSFWVSVRIGLVVTIVATILGTMISFALIRYRFRGQLVTNSMIFLPIATPEVILGASLLALFLNIYVPLGFWTITIAHILFTISFVVVVVNARLAGLDPRLEQAAMDLYATPF